MSYLMMKPASEVENEWVYVNESCINAIVQRDDGTSLIMLDSGDIVRVEPKAEDILREMEEQVSLVICGRKEGS